MLPFYRLNSSILIRSVSGSAILSKDVFLFQFRCDFQDKEKKRESPWMLIIINPSYKKKGFLFLTGFNNMQKVVIINCFFCSSFAEN